MKLIKSLLLGSAAGLTAVAGAQAADLPVKKAAPIEYVRVCGAYGAGFFYIPGTDTCLRVSGRARGEAGINTSPNRRSSGDVSQFRGLLRINIDARTQTDYGTLRAFARLEAASATGEGKMASGTQARIGNAFFGTGQDAFNRVQDYVQAEKAFIQFAGLTAGRASSFFDFYAHDFEIIGSSLGSDQASTNIFAYTKTFGEGWSATISMEDPNFRKNPIYSNGGALPGSINANGNTIGQLFTGIGTNAPSPVVLNFGPTGAVANVGYVDVVQRSRMPDFVGALRYDQPWGSLQVSGAVKDVNTGGFLGTITTNPGQAALTTAGAAAALAARGISSGAQTDYGWAIQGGAKFNLPFISPGDSLYLQGAYGEGAANYTGYTSYIGRYTQATGIVSGGPWNVYMNDAVINPITGKLELSSSWTVVASYLHYWTPQWRSAVYGSYGEMHQPGGAVAGLRGLAGGTGIGGLPSANPASATASSTLVSTSQVVTGASLIWSPVKDLDIGAEGQYIRVDTLNGQRVLNTDTGRLVSGQDQFQARVRVQRDF